MSKKKFILTISVLMTFLAVAFMISFNWGMEKFGEKNNNKVSSSNEAGSDKVTSAINTDLTVSPNAKIILKLQYIKSGDILNIIVNTADFAGKSKSELENENYTVERIDSSEVVLTKKIDSYSPNKYVLGIKDGCLAIYRTDEEGNMYIENESTDLTEIQVPTEGDYNLLVKGSKSFQFDSKEEAQDKLGEYDS